MVCPKRCTVRASKPGHGGCNVQWDIVLMCNERLSTYEAVKLAMPEWALDSLSIPKWIIAVAVSTRCLESTRQPLSGFPFQRHPADDRICAGSYRGPGLFQMIDSRYRWVMNVDCRIGLHRCFISRIAPIHLRCA